MKQLPYRVQTATGDTLDIEFPFHAETESPVNVNQLLTTILETINKEVALAGPMANGDVLQSLAMAIAIRARMIHAPSEVTADLARTLTTCALDATTNAKISRAMHGNA